MFYYVMFIGDMMAPQELNQCWGYMREDSHSHTLTNSANLTMTFPAIHFETASPSLLGVSKSPTL